ncbi:MAG: hypothetical protein ACOYON_03765 [Fimbriimonas sp.]
MRPRLTHLVFGTALLAVVASAQAADWTRYKYPENGFSVTLPIAPVKQTQSQSEVGLSVTTDIYISRDKAVTTVVSVSKLPANTSKQVKQNLIEGIKSGFLRSTKATGTADKSQKYGGLEGRLIQFKLPAGPEGAMWIYEVKDKVYALTILGPAPRNDSVASKFFGSFKVL